MSDPNPRRCGLAILAALILALAAGCAPTPPSPSADHTALTTGHADADVQRWIEFRRTYGLRTELERVLAVADSPEALRSYGVPLLEFEEAQVIRLQLNAEALLDHVHGYGNRCPDEFGGVWIEAPLVVIALTDRIPEHRAAVQALFGPNVIVRPVQFTLRDLNIWAADVGEQAAWFETIGAHLAGGQVRMEIWNCKSSTAKIAPCRP